MNSSKLQLVASVPDCDMIIIMGGFNARVGSNFEQWGAIISTQGHSERYENDEYLTLLCMQC